MLTVRTTHDGDTSTVTIAGEIDLATSTRVNRELVMALERSPARLCVDLGDVPFMDTTGVAVLLTARRRALELGGAFCVTSTSPAITRLFEITGLTGLLSES